MEVLETGVAMGAAGAGAGVAATGVGLIVGAAWGTGSVAAGVAATGTGGVGAGVSGAVAGVGAGVSAGVVTGATAGVGAGVATAGEDAAGAGADADVVGSGAGAVVGRCGCGATLQAIKRVKKSRFRIAEKSCCMPVGYRKGAPLAFCYGTRVNALPVVCIVKRWCIRRDIGVIERIDFVNSQLCRQSRLRGGNHLAAGRTH